MSQVLPQRRSDGRGTASRWEPVNELQQVTEQMRRLLEQTFGPDIAAAVPTDVGAWAPAVDIEEEDDAYVIEADLPGVKRDDVNIDLIGNELTVTGEIKERERKGLMRRRMRRVGQFEFRVALPEQVDSEKIEARLDDGVLKVRVPKSQRAQRRHIEVQK